MEYAKAKAIADQWIERLRPYCDRAQIAGSLRRLQPEVGDIEIVQAGVLMDSLFPAWLNSRPGICLKLKKNGPRYKQMALPEGVNLDLFIVLPPAQWGVIFAIRTGPAAFSHWLVTSKQYGGALPPYLRVQNGVLWHGYEIVETPEEKDFFEAIGIPFVEPRDRKGPPGF